MSQTPAVTVGERSEPDASGRKHCPTCRVSKPGSEFYAGVAECKACKRDRSRRNRADQACKIAAFERFVDALIAIADKTGDPPAERKQKAVA
jgi:hypothetical protein